MAINRIEENGVNFATGDSLQFGLKDTVAFYTVPGTGALGDSAAEPQPVVLVDRDTPVEIFVSAIMVQNMLEDPRR